MRSRLGFLAGVLAPALVAGAGLGGLRSLEERRAAGAGRGRAAEGGDGPARLGPRGAARSRSSRCSGRSWTRSMPRDARSRSSGAISPADLYNIQQQLVQLQELTGQSQQRLTELRTQLEARGAQIGARRPLRATARGPTPQGGTASADQMYEASLAQLRRGSHSTARLGLAGDAARSTPPASGRRTRSISSARASPRRTPTPRPPTTAQVVEKYPASPRAASALYNLGLLAERRKDTAGARDAYQRVVAEVPAVRRSRAGSRPTEGARALSPGVRPPP